MTPYDRTGEPEHDPRCRDGWIDRDADNPVPCVVCKPHLALEKRRARTYGPYHPAPTRTPEKS